MVVAGSQHAQVVACSDGTRVQWCRVAERSRISCYRCLLQVITSLTTNDETLVRERNISDRVDVTAAWVVGEETAHVCWALLEVEGELVGLCAVLCRESRQELGFQAIGEGVVELDLGVDDVGGGEGLGDGDSYIVKSVNAWSTRDKRSKKIQRLGQKLHTSKNALPWGSLVDEARYRAVRFGAVNEGRTLCNDFLGLELFGTRR